MIIDLFKLMRNQKALGGKPCRKNQRVELVTKRFEPSASNPRRSTIYACEGVVEYISKGAVQVMWDNGQRNGYEPVDLMVCDFPFVANPRGFYPDFKENNPNLTFKKVKAYYGMNMLNDLSSAGEFFAGGSITALEGS